MARKKDTPQKAALREMMGNYLKENNVTVKDGTDVNSIMRDMMSIILEGALDLVLCQEKVQIKSNQFSLCLAKLNLLFLSHYLLDFSDILPHIGLGINTRNGCEYVLYCKMFLCIQKSTYMHVYN